MQGVLGVGRRSPSRPELEEPALLPADLHLSSKLPKVAVRGSLNVLLEWS